jgi:hypothetical protein
MSQAQPESQDRAAKPGAGPEPTPLQKVVGCLLAPFVLALALAVAAGLFFLPYLPWLLGRWLFGGK